MLARLLVAAAFAVSLLCLAAPFAHAGEDDAAVTVVHGVPGLTVDVYVNGSLAIPGFEPGTITDPLPFAPDTYDLAIVPAGGDPMMPAIAGSATVEAGDRVSIVAHLAADGTPTLSIFEDDLHLADAGQGRLIVRHAAAAPAVDAILARKIWRFRIPAGTLENLANGNQTSVDTWAGRYGASLAPAGSDDVVFGPANVRIKRDKATIVYAVGDLAGGTFQLLVAERDLSNQTANVTVVHGVLGLTVDIYVDGSLAIPGFQPRTITDPIPLPCGETDLAVVPAGGALADAVLSATVDLAAGSDSTVVAHLDADGAPTLSVFGNDLARNGWRSRLVVRHTAAAPAVDAILERSIRWWRYTAGVLEDAENGQQASVDVFAGRYIASVTPANTPGTVVLGPAPLKLKPRTATFVYAIGSLADGSLELLVQTRALR